MASSSIAKEASIQDKNTEKNPADPKPCICKKPGCPKSFSSNSQLNRHISQVHNTAVYICPFSYQGCNQRSKRSDKVVNHCREHHLVTGHQLETLRQYIKNRCRRSPTINPGSGDFQPTLQPVQSLAGSASSLSAPDPTFHHPEQQYAQDIFQGQGYHNSDSEFVEDYAAYSPLDSHSTSSQPYWL